VFAISLGELWRHRLNFNLACKLTGFPKFSLNPYQLRISCSAINDLRRINNDFLMDTVKLFVMACLNQKEPLKARLKKQMLHKRGRFRLNALKTLPKNIFLVPNYTSGFSGLYPKIPFFLLAL
jgi:hypothetical protein